MQLAVFVSIARGRFRSARQLTSKAQMYGDTKK